MENRTAFRMIMIMVVLAAALAVFAGCGSAQAPEEDQQSAAQTEAAAESESEEILDLSEAAGDLSQAGKTGSQQSDDRVGPEYGQVLVCIDEPDGYANVRTGRGSSYDAVGTLKNGTVIAVYGPTNEWLEIASGQYAGRFVHKSTVNYDWDQETTVFSQFVSTSDGYANVRSGRGSSYEAVGKLYNGTMVYVSGLQDGWYEIQYGQYTGKFIHKSQLSDLQPDMAKEEVFYVSEPDGYANVRIGRGTGYNVVGKLPNGTAVYVTALQDGWYEICRGSLKGGFISKSTLVK